MAYATCSEITDKLIPEGVTIVFDWDNTLKLYNREKRQISSRVDKESLHHWRTEKQCDMYIISAIYPSKINLETLLFEVNKLGLLEFFTKEDDRVEVHAGKFARKGNIMICGYDKAETFINVTKTAIQGTEADQSKDQQTTHTKLPEEFAGCDVADGIDSYYFGNSYENTGQHETNARDGDIVFFDDEEINIINFSALVPNSKCFLVK